MKKGFFTFFLLLYLVNAGFCETYYWVGGAGPASFTALANWNKQLDGNGLERAAAAADDILIFDGTNIGGTVPATGTVTVTMTTNAIGQLELLNNANVIIQRPSLVTGTGTLTINGDADPVTPDFLVGTGCSISINSPSTDGSIVISFPANATGSVGGTISISNSGSHRFSANTIGALLFTAGATFNSGGTSTTYPFGSSTQGVNLGVVFQAGSNLVVTTARSPFGGTSTHQSCNMQPGSNFYLRGAITASTATGSWSNLKTYGNMFIQSGATFTSDGPFYKIDTLTIETGCKLTTHSSGNTPILGNLSVNGTLDAPGGSSNIVVMGGNTAQTISGSGSIVIPSFTVANHSDVTLSRTVTVNTTCNIVGKLNFGTSQITGTATFTSRVRPAEITYTGTTTTGSYQLTGVTAPSGVTGLYITGPGIAANTNVVGFSSSNSLINLSKAAVSGNVGGTYTFSSDSATLATANPNGMDTLTGSVIVSGSKSFQGGTNYIINTATTKPFGISSGTPLSITAGNVVLNAPVTTNYNMRMGGTLTLNTGKLTIRAQDSLRILYGNDIAGAPFSSSKYIVSSVSGANAGVLRIDNFAASKTFPIGTPTSYLPATLTPASTMNFAVSVFEGVTMEGTPTGTPFNASQKSGVVDAVWTIDRTSGSGDCGVSLSWPSSLEGAAFATFSDASVGIGRHNGAGWDIVTGSGNNTTNTASSTFSSFSPFSIGQVGFLLPVKFKGISAKVLSAGVEVSWQVLQEEANTRYAIEKSMDGSSFSAMGLVLGSNKGSYTYTDATPFTGKCFYRIKVMAANGSVTYSSIIAVMQESNPVVNVYPNPVVSALNISGLQSNSILKIVTANGRVVLQQKTGANALSIDIADYKPGLYVLEIHSANSRVIAKTFIKQ